MAVSQTQLPWLMLRLLPDMTRVRFYTLFDHFQSPELVLGAPAKEIASLRGFDNSLARKVLQAPKAVELYRELDLMEQHNVHLVTIEDEDYPENLRNSSFPPPILYVRGTLEPRDRYCIAMVGSRNATQYGKAVAQQFAARLAACGITVVSGFARGVDSQAHEAAIRAGGRTLGILGNGLSICYPAENRRLADRVAAQGALISEYPMETSPDRYNFPERNHVIAAISLGTLVVEAGQRSGALITANEALEENRSVFAIPGDINRANSFGTNALIQSGARLVQRPDEILDEMKDVLKDYLREESMPADGPGDSAQRPGVGRTQVAGPARPLTDEEKCVLELIRHEPQYFDVIFSRLDADRFTPQKLSSVLLSLELKQVIRQLPGKLYSAV